MKSQIWQGELQANVVRVLRRYHVSQTPFTPSRMWAGMLEHINLGRMYRVLNTTSWDSQSANGATTSAVLQPLSGRLYTLFNTKVSCRYLYACERLVDVDKACPTVDVSCIFRGLRAWISYLWCGHIFYHVDCWQSCFRPRFSRHHERWPYCHRQCGSAAQASAYVISSHLFPILAADLCLPQN